MIADIKGKAVFTALGTLTGPLCRIAKSNATANLFKREAKPENMTMQEFVASRIEGALPEFVAECQDDIVTVLAVVNQQTEEEYLETLTLPKLLKDVMELVNDGVLADFFPQPASTSEDAE